LIVATGTVRAATQERIGSWVLTCSSNAPAAEPCLLQSDKRLFDEAGITVDLEVLALGKSLVPVIALRGLSNEILMVVAMAGETQASVRFGGGPQQDLTCGASGAAYVCSPKDDAARELAARLPVARSVTVIVSIGVAGTDPLTIRAKSLDLSGTTEALARLRKVGPSRVQGPMTRLASPSSSALMGMVNEALKAAGYPNGAADLPALVAKYIRK
jgi:hypothetical protein